PPARARFARALSLALACSGQRASWRLPARTQMVRQSRCTFGTVSFTSPFVYRHRPRFGRLGGSGAAGSQHHSRPALGRLLSSDFWGWHNCGNDADYGGVGYALFLCRNPFRLVKSRSDCGLRRSQSLLRTLHFLPHRLRRRPVYQSPQLDAELIFPHPPYYGFFAATASSTVL